MSLASYYETAQSGEAARELAIEYHQYACGLKVAQSCRRAEELIRVQPLAWQQQRAEQSMK